MVSLSGFLLIYVLGGLTFIPLVLLATFIHAKYTLPVRDPDSKSSRDAPDKITEGQNGSRDANDDFKFGGKLPEQLKVRTHEPDAAAGYFAVCREYVPGGVNGKPPERTTPAGEIVATETTPSVYQSMYRSIFDRNRNQGPTLDNGKGNTKIPRKARNVFFVALRHGHLMLYDDSEQVEVRHVISLAHHNVDLYGGDEIIPEGELFIKRNCIRLNRHRTAGDIDPDAKPYYLFSENCSAKEDFYHALLANQVLQSTEPGKLPTPLTFDTQHLVKLVQQLHASEDTLQTRWFNAIVGRVFLSIYRTPEIADFIRGKITKKIARVRKPTFISSVTVQNINMGDAAPTITHPKLKELTVDGELTGEADVHYQGNFSIEILTVARIELGSRFKPREVHLVLRGTLKRLEGHVLIRVKPPPSNRLWISFEKPPHMEMAIEPIVISRQITYGFILRAIENRIREVVAETLVYPNWDDVPFFETFLQRSRGGIWQNDVKPKPTPDSQTDAAEHGLVDKIDKDSESDEAEHIPAPSEKIREKTMSMPSLVDEQSSRATVKHRKSVSNQSIVSLDAASVDRAASNAEVRTTKPRVMRSTSFASAATPTVTLDPATVEALKSPAKMNAQSAMKDISMRSPQTSPLESPVGSPPSASIMETASQNDGTSSIGSHDSDSTSLASSPPKGASTRSSVATTDTSSSQESARSKYATSVAASRAGLNQAAAAAKKWWGNRQAQHSPSTSATFTSKDAAAILRGEKELPHVNAPAPGTPSNPIGRGQPLPPPGMPLPKPRETGGWYLTKRKAVAPASSAHSPAHTPAIPATPTRRDSGPTESAAADIESFLRSAPVSNESEQQGSTDHESKSNTTTTLKSDPQGPDSKPLPSPHFESVGRGSGPAQTITRFEQTAQPVAPQIPSSSRQNGNSRRKSSTASQLSNHSATSATPPSPRPASAPMRRKRLSVARSAHSLEEDIEQPTLVIEAPKETSPLESPSTTRSNGMDLPSDEMLQDRPDDDDVSEKENAQPKTPRDFLTEVRDEHVPGEVARLQEESLDGRQSQRGDHDTLRDESDSVFLSTMDM